MERAERVVPVDGAARVAEIAGRVVDAPTLGMNDSLAEAGYDSLAYAELALVLEEELGVRLADLELEALQTPAAIAAAAARSRRGDGAGLPRGFGGRQAMAARALGPVLARWYRFEIRGAEHFPLRGPAVLCANHNSLLDIPFLVLGSPRPVWFMAKVELFPNAAATRFWSALGGFPVARGRPDLPAIETAMRILRAGRVLGMFPEGTRSPDVLLPFLPGAAWVALVAGAPLVPAGIRGAAESLPRGRVIPKRTDVRLAFGEPIPVEREPDPARRKARARELTAELRSVVERLLA